MDSMYFFLTALLVMCLTACGGSDSRTADVDSDADSDSGTQLETDSNGDSASEFGADSESGFNNNVDTSAESDSDSDTGSDSNTDADGDTDNTVEAETDSVSESEDDTGTETDTTTESGTDTHADTARMDTESAPVDFRLPPADALWDYQIGGGYTPPDGVQVVSRDREDSPAPGLYNICYVNGFQIQPHEESWWQTIYPDLILRDSNGDPVVDADWDEMLLDVRTPANREALAVIVGEWIAGCAEDGFDAVEIDNLDSYSRSDSLISQTDNIAFMGMLSDIAHENGLAAAQKNAAAFLAGTDRMKTDFAVVEECNRWKECGDFKDAYGDLLFIVEYRTQDFEAGCSAFPELSIVLRNINVSTPASASYVYDGC